MRMFSKLRRITARSSVPVIGVAASAGGFTLPVAAKWNHRTLPAGTRTILYFDSRRPVLVPPETPRWPGILYVPLNTEAPGVPAIGPGRSFSQRPS